MEFGIWGNTIVAGQRDAAIPNSTSTLTVWQNGQKIDTVKVPAGLPQQFAVSRGGYVAIIMNTAYARDDDFNPLSRGIVAFLYKLNVAKTVSTPITPSPVIPPFVPPPSSGSCTATLTFTPTSVVSGGPVTESWKIEGADVGQTFTDCGQGEVAISAGPLSKVINPTKTLTCRVYGKIDGKEMCTSPKVTVIVAATQAQADTPNATITIINNPVTTPRTTPANTPIPPAQNNLGNTSTSLSTSTSYNLGTTTLRQGSIGPAVVELQRFLNDTLNAGLVVDGTMNPITVATLKTWQSANGLTADGVVGTKTKSLMNTPASNPTTSSKPASYNFGTNTLRRGSTGPAVKELQRFLNDTLNLGLVLDGKLGPKTIAVIKTWQANHGLVADGLVGPKTKKAMLASY
jgi:peptidoglycan hydrolase-like protein with peptidoglycan-binding domain